MKKEKLNSLVNIINEEADICENIINGTECWSTTDCEKMLEIRTLINEMVSTPMRIEDYYYLDADTFVAVFNKQTDESGEGFNFEVEYDEHDEEWSAYMVYDQGIVNIDVTLLPNGMLDMAKDTHKRLDNMGSVSNCIVNILGDAIPKDYVFELRDNILNYVINDLVETADDDWNNDDVALAIGRVLVKMTTQN